MYSHLFLDFYVVRIFKSNAKYITSTIFICQTIHNLVGTFQTHFLNANKTKQNKTMKLIHTRQFRIDILMNTVGTI